MVAMVKDIPSILLDRLSGSKTQFMTDLSKLVANKGSAPMIGFICLSLIGKPSDEDLERYPAVHLTGPHEWDPSVLDSKYASGDGEPPWSNDPTERYGFDPNFDEFGDYTHRAIQTLNILDDSS